MKKIFLTFTLLLFAFYGNTQEISSTIENKVLEVDAQNFKKILQKTPDAQLIDIRTPQEYYSGHIPKAQLINFYDREFEKNIQEAGLDKNRPVFIYCRSGNRTGHAINIFKKLGFKKIIELDHGIIDWYRNGFTLEK